MEDVFIWITGVGFVGAVVLAATAGLLDGLANPPDWVIYPLWGIVWLFGVVWIVGWVGLVGIAVIGLD